MSKKSSINLSEFDQRGTKPSKKFGVLQSAQIQAEAVREAVESMTEGFLPDKVRGTPPDYAAGFHHLGPQDWPGPQAKGQPMILLCTLLILAILYGLIVAVAERVPHGYERGLHKSQYRCKQCGFFVHSPDHDLHTNWHIRNDQNTKGSGDRRDPV